jgi:cyclophilin family peptidyl-prolyl cis-trans isomerase
VPPADKRQRQKENARLAREARERALRQQRQRKTAIRVAVIAVPFIALFVFLALRGGNDNKSTSTTTTVALADAAGKPCVAMKDTPPKGAPTVPVVVGAPPKTLVKRDLEVGKGAVVQPGATVLADYIGVSCSTGKIFDSSYKNGQPGSFSLNEVIKGWTDGIPGMKVGGRRLLGIPAAQGYGAPGQPPDIAANEALWYIVDILGIKASPPTSTTVASVPTSATATITTNYGTIVIDLDTKHAPNAAARFIALAKAGWYDNQKWGRAAKGYVIQGGSPNGTQVGGEGHPILGEVPKDHYPVGAVAAAHGGSDAPGTFDSQFFIVTGPGGESLPNDYARFGTVTKGLDVAKKIDALAPASGDGIPTKTATIDKITITEH